MNKQELIDKAVHELKGALRNHKDYYFEQGQMYLYFPLGSMDRMHLCTIEQFQQRARELGYINGYRWGVEYPTNGKEPNLPDDVVVNQYSTANNKWYAGTVGVWNWSLKTIIKLKITDQRYKPADTSYLDNPDSYLDNPDSSIDNSADWYDYDNQKALRLPPVGDKSVSYLAGDGVWIGCEVAAHYNSGAIVAHNDGFTLVYKHKLRPNNFHARKARAERKRVVDAAQKECVNFSSNDLGRLYDAGFLRMPDDK